MEFKNGSSALITIILMLLIVSVAAFGFIIFITKMNENAVVVNNDPTNFSGITYNTDMYNTTNATLHGLSATMPDLIWIVIIFLAVVFLTLVAIGLKRH